jgi:subtilase family serine protease
MRYRLLGAVASLAVIAAFGVLGASRAAPASRVAVATPMSVVLGGAHWAQPPTTAQCVNQTGFACYRPAQFQQAYNLRPLYARGLNGAGKTIIIVDSFGSPTIRADLATFDRSFHLPPPPHFRVLQPVGAVPPFDPSNSTMVGWAEETSLDVEYSHAMAPGANIVLLETPVAETEGTVGFPQIVAAENFAINHHLGDVISQSFGATEETFPSPHAIFRLRSAYFNALVHHVTVLASSGDTGVSNDHFNGVTLYTHRVVGWPSSDPLVTSVGGLQLHLNAQGNRLLPDNVWNESTVFGTAVAGSGGPSHVFGRPGYQNSVAGIVGRRRGTPDISLSAAVNGGALVYWSFAGQPPAFYIVGGTSEASPQFAGIVAIADQAAHHDLGLLNPSLYALGSGSAGIPDITIGNNTVTFTQNGHTYTVPGFDAVPGYDMASGLGTVNGFKLVSALAH